MTERGRVNGFGANGIPSVFDVCTPRKDIRDGIVESELAADLSQVAGGGGLPEYSDPAKFFESTYPTKGIRNLLQQVLTRLKGRSSSAIFWLNTSFGGGKTHTLIALLHAAKSPAPDTMDEFVDPSLLPGERVRMAVFDGQNADISSGHSIGDGINARTPWGEIAYGLAGRGGYRRVDDSIDGSPPGADTLKELIGDGPTLILLDELGVYLRKAARHGGAGGQLVAFLTALIKAVEGSQNAALVYTLAAGDGDGDAYRDENLKLHGELASVSARKATLLNPTEEGETIQILRRRLFERRDESLVDVVVDAYRKAWKDDRDKLPDVVDMPKTESEFRAGYPLHPDILNTLITKTSTLENFQRVRGMLRILGHVVHGLWKRMDEIKPTAIHLHHFDLGNENIRQEITARLNQEMFATAIDTDVACDDANKTSMAQRLDKEHYPDLAPFTTYVTRVIFMNTLAHNQRLKGVDMRSLRYSVLWPGMEIGYVDEALDRFKDRSLYLDDNPQKPTQFQAAANLTQAIRHAEQSLDDSDLESEIDSRMRTMFQKGEFALYLFPGGHEDIPDDIGAPKLVIPKYSMVDTSNPESAPDMVDDIFRHKGIGAGIRAYRNNIVFLVAYSGGVDAMYAAARHHLAMLKMSEPSSFANFADYQQDAIREKSKTSDASLAKAILGCYKYAYYPKGAKLSYATIEWGGGGQRFLIDRLRHIKKIRMADDLPDSPDSLVDRIAKLKNDGEMTVLELRNEFYMDASLPMLIGNGVFDKGIRLGINDGVFVYKSGELVCGKGDPECRIIIDEDSVVYTTKEAGRRGIWPRKQPPPPPPSPPPPPPPTPLQPISAAGKPSVAVRSILDELRKRDITKISKIRIESKDDVFPLLSAIGRIRDIEVKSEMNGDYGTDAGGTFSFEFSGTLKDSEPIQEFLKPQLRQTSIPNMHVTLDMNSKTVVDADWLERLAERLKWIDNDIKISIPEVPR